MLTVVMGAPNSGKTTYVKLNSKPGDVVIDFDLMAEALGSPVDHGHNAPITRVTVAAWHAAVTEAIRCHRLGARVWIVDTNPPKARRQRYHIAGATMLGEGSWRQEAGRHRPVSA